MRKNLRMPEELNMRVRDRTRFKGDLSKTISHCVEKVDLYSVPLYIPEMVTETAMHVIIDDDLHNRLATVADTRGCSINRLINSAIASCLQADALPVETAAAAGAVGM